MSAIESGREQAAGVTLIVLEGGVPRSRPEEMLADVRRAIVLDTIEKAKRVRGISRIIVGTDVASLADEAADLGAAIDWEPDTDDGLPFHWGARLQRLLARRPSERVVVLGGGAAPLLTVSDLERVIAACSGANRAVFANNVYSADIVAFHPAEELLRVVAPANDNALATTLHERAGLRLGRLPYTLGLHFDVDTPVDLMVLAVHPDAGPHTRARIDALGLDLGRVAAVQATLVDTFSDLLLFGRINARLFGMLDEATRCRLRLFSEERGMKSLGRDARGEVVSLIGYLLDVAGPERFIAQLASVCRAALLDTRVLFAHQRLNVSARDRFLSDLGSYEEIRDPSVRALTRAVVESDIPILTGGHSLVTGGIWALVDALSEPHGKAPRGGANVTEPGERRQEFLGRSRNG